MQRGAVEEGLDQQWAFQYVPCYCLVIAPGDRAAIAGLVVWSSVTGPNTEGQRMSEVKKDVSLRVQVHRWKRHTVQQHHNLHWRS